MTTMRRWREALSLFFLNNNESEDEESIFCSSVDKNEKRKGVKAQACRGV
jgi:hypothetical protein